VILEAFGFDKHPGYFGELGLEPSLQLGDPGLDGGGRYAVVEIEAERYQHSSVRNAPSGPR